MHSMWSMATIDIIKLRKRLGDISQAELGRRLGGVSQSTISRWETGIDEPEGPAAIVLRQLDEATPAEEEVIGSRSDVQQIEAAQ